MNWILINACTFYTIAALTIYYFGSSFQVPTHADRIFPLERRKTTVQYLCLYKYKYCTSRRRSTCGVRCAVVQYGSLVVARTCSWNSYVAFVVKLVYITSRAKAIFCLRGTVVCLFYRQYSVTSPITQIYNTPLAFTIHC